MGSVSFFLRSTSDENQKIYLKVNYGRKKQLRYATGYEVINPKNWDPSKYIIKNVQQETQSHFINSKLGDLLAFCNKFLHDHKGKTQELNNKKIKKEIDIFLEKEKKQQSISDKTFLEFYEWFIDYYEANPLPSTNKPLSKNTVRPYRTSLKNLKEYFDETEILDFNGITLEFHKNYLKYLQEKKFSNNYIGNQIKLIKAIMNNALERGLHTNLDFKKRSFHKPREGVYAIYLSEKELKRIEELDYSEEPKLDNARDLFLIGAYTGLRVSDFNKLSKKNIMTKHSTTFFEIKTQKTGKVVGIPIHPVVKKILSKRNGELPKKMPEQHINVALKKIGEKAKINEKVTIEKTLGGKKDLTTYDKYDLITNHTARRSFCTNAYLANMPVFDIMAISGHTNEKTFYSYIKITPMEQIEKLAKHPFFN